MASNVERTHIEGKDPHLHTVNPLIVTLESCLPHVSALLADVQTIHLLHILIGKIHLKAQHTALINCISGSLDGDVILIMSKNSYQLP